MNKYRITRIREVREMREYEKRAEDFLNETGTILASKFLKHGLHFDDDTEKRDIYQISLKRDSREYIFNFGQSIAESINPKYRKKINHLKSRAKEGYPSDYDILVCLQTYPLGDFKDFCESCGYGEDSRRAEKIYKAVLIEFENLKMLYSDQELVKLGEIQ